MKKALLYIISCITFSSTFESTLSAQCDPGHPLWHTSCELAVENLICDLNDIATGCFDLTPSPNPQPLEVECLQSFTEFLNPYFFAFVAGSEVVSIDVFYQNCTGSNPGIQAALFEYNPSVCVGEVLDCFNFCDIPQEVQSLTSEVVPGNIYILAINLCNDEVCEVNLLVNDFIPFNPQPIEFLYCSNTSCQYEYGEIFEVYAETGLPLGLVEYNWLVTYEDGSMQNFTTFEPTLAGEVTSCSPFEVTLVQVNTVCDTLYPNLTQIITPITSSVTYISTSTNLQSGETYLAEFTNLNAGDVIIVNPSPNPNVEGAQELELDATYPFYQVILTNTSSEVQVQELEVILYSSVGCNDTISILLEISPQRLSQIGGIVWEEKVYDCHYDHEKGIANISLDLVLESGIIVASTMTDSTGNFVFPAVKEGEYKVVIPINKIPNGAEICPKYEDANMKELYDNNGMLSSTGVIETTIFTQGAGDNYSIGFALRLNCSKIGQLTCQEAFNDPIIDLNTIINCETTMPTFDNPALPNEFHCEPSTNQFQNVTFTSFYTGEGDYYINLNFFECFNTSNIANPPTIQLGLYEATCDRPKYIICETNLETNGGGYSYIISSDSLKPHTKYMLWIDGYNKSVCSYNIYVEGSYEPHDRYRIDTITILTPDISTICNLGEYIFTAQNANLDLRAEEVDSTWWTVSFNGNIIDKPKSNNLDMRQFLDTYGVYDIVLDSILFANGCVLKPNRIWTITLFQEILDEDFGVVELCRSELATYLGPSSVDGIGVITDPNGDGTHGWVYQGQVFTAGFNTNYASSSEGCDYQQYVFIEVIENPVISATNTLLSPFDITVINSNQAGIFTVLSGNSVTVTNSGVVTAVQEGCSEIQMTSDAGCVSNVIEICVLSDTTNPILLDTSFCVGDMEQILNAAGFTFISLDTAIVRVSDSGLIEAISSGTTQIEVMGPSGAIELWTVIVHPEPVYNIAGNDTIRVGEMLLISANPGVWTSSNIAIATININGLVTGISPGFVNFMLTDLASGCSVQTTPIVVLPAIKDFVLCGTAYNDSNNNGVRDAGESPLPDFKIIHPTTNLTLFTDANGFYSFELSRGSQTILAEATYGSWQAVLLDTTVDLQLEKTQVDFGFVPVDSMMTFGIDVNTTLLRCNTFAFLQMNVSNKGNFSTIATVKLTLDPTISYVQFDPQPISITANEYTFAISNLGVGASFNPYIRIGVPPFFPAQDSLRFGIEVYDAQGNLAATKLYTDVIRCSYDPNDKRVSPDRPGDDNPTLVEEVLEYNIRFQNNGNDTAFYVEIQDVIDPRLDLDAIQMGESSHPVEVMIHLDTLFFKFRNIALVDSATNYELSQGFVSFKIPIRQEVMVGEIIHNTAAIVFDKNEPIITNTSVNTIVSFLECYHLSDELRVEELSLIADEGGLRYLWKHCEEQDTIFQSTTNVFTPSKSGIYQVIIEGDKCIKTSQCISFTLTNTTTEDIDNINIYPNPSTGRYHVVLPKGAEISAVVNVAGQQVGSYRDAIIDITTEPSGVYLVKVKVKDKVLVSRLIKW